jgi:hypothetical protein
LPKPGNNREQITAKSIYSLLKENRMNPRNKVFLVLLAALAVMVIIACSCTDLSFLNIGGDNQEAMPGLAGTWQDPQTTDTFVIAWQNGQYVVTSVTFESTTYDITEQSWSGTALTWTYYIPEYETYLSYETTSLSGDSLNTNWWNDGGGSGTEILERVR